jgi:RNA polymerase-binding transcription factor DksA
VRAEGSDKPHEVLDPGETSEADIQEDIEFALIQMKAETLNKINEALARLDEGRLRPVLRVRRRDLRERLRALPFAVRCKDCEEARENAAKRERMLAPSVAARASSTTCGGNPAPVSGRLRRWWSLPSPPAPHRSAEGHPIPEHVIMRRDRDERSCRAVEGAEEPADDGPQLPEELPILPLRDTVLFPNSFMPLAVARESSVRLIDDAVASGRLIGVFTQREAGEEEPQQRDLYPVGVASHIHKMFKLPDGSLRIIVQGLARVRLRKVVESQPFLRGR